MHCSGGTELFRIIFIISLNLCKNPAGANITVFICRHMLLKLLPILKPMALNRTQVVFKGIAHKIYLVLWMFARGLLRADIAALLCFVRPSPRYPDSFLALRTCPFQS